MLIISSNNDFGLRAKFSAFSVFTSQVSLRSERATHYKNSIRITTAESIFN